MKQTITRDEFALLDKLACAGDQLHQALESFLGLPDLSLEHITQARDQLVAAVNIELAVDGWDQEKRRIVRNYIEQGSRQPVEHLLDELGVTVSDSVIESSQGGN